MRGSKFGSLLVRVIAPIARWQAKVVASSVVIIDPYRDRRGTRAAVARQIGIGRIQVDANMAIDLLAEISIRPLTQI